MKIIKGGLDAKREEFLKRKRFFAEHYRKMYYNAVLSTECINYEKAVLCGIKYGAVTIVDTTTSAKDILMLFTEMNDIVTYLGMLTYSQILQLFPIRKDYDGEKYCAKDYWSTMEYLKGKDMDSEIGEAADEFLWNYYNDDIINFSVKRTLLLDKLLKAEGREGLMEGFIRAAGKEKEIHTYTIHREEGYIYDNMTGKTAKIVSPRKRRPKNLSIIK